MAIRMDIETPLTVTLPTLEQIHAAYEKGEATVVELFAKVGEQVKTVLKQVQDMADALHALQAQVAKDSHNSHKAPSSDSYRKKNTDNKKTKSLRQRSGKPNGGQPGHAGHTLNRVDQPDHTQLHEVCQCAHCSANLNDTPVTAIEERQVFDIPAIRIEVTAHQAEVKVCPHCGTVNHGVFPEGVNAPVQYGNGVKAWAAYFQNQQLIPLDRTAQIFEDLLGQSISEATLLKMNDELVERVKPATAVIQQQQCQAEVLDVDESGLRVAGKLHWLHVASTKHATYYHIHAKRGQEAMDDAGILPNFQGILVHDHWKTYFNYNDCQHALCNAHHLRELIYLEEQYQQSWARDMIDLLCEIHTTVETTKQQSDHLPLAQQEAFNKRYDEIVAAGYAANPPPLVDPSAPKKRGRRKQSPMRNLLDRFRDYKADILRFMTDFRVPFDNNLAESDIRMGKLKQKISGCFRTLTGAKGFASVRSYISTARKNGVNIFCAIRDAFAGKPFILSPTEPVTAD